MAVGDAGERCQLAKIASNTFDGDWICQPCDFMRSPIILKRNQAYYDLFKLT